MSGMPPITARYRPSQFVISGDYEGVSREEMEADDGSVTMLKKHAHLSIPPPRLGVVTRIASGSLERTDWPDEEEPDQHRMLPKLAGFRNPRGCVDSGLILGRSTLETMEDGGWGAFAKQDFAEKTLIGSVCGLWCTNEETAERLTPGYTMEIPEKLAALHGIKKRFLSMNMRNNVVYVNDALDEKENNAQFKFNLNQGDPDKFIQLWAVKPIRARREVCADYMDEHWGGSRLMAAGPDLLVRILTHHPKLEAEYRRLKNGQGTASDPVLLEEPPSPEEDEGKKPVVKDLELPPVRRLAGAKKPGGVLVDRQTAGGVGPEKEHTLSGYAMANLEIIEDRPGTENLMGLTALEAFTKRTRSSVQDAVANSVQTKTVDLAYKAASGFGTFLLLHDLHDLYVEGAKTSDLPTPQYERVVRLPVEMQSHLFIEYGNAVARQGRGVNGELSSLKMAFELEGYPAPGFGTAMLKRSRSGFKTMKDKMASIKAKGGITSEMMLKHIEMHKAGYPDSDEGKEAFLASTAILIAYDKGKRLCTLLHTSAKAENRRKKAKPGGRVARGRASVYHTIPVKNLVLMTEDAISRYVEEFRGRGFATP